MNTQQPTDGHNPSNNLSCTHCHTQLPPQAVFCGSCGKPVKKIWDWEVQAKEGENDTKDAVIDTVRIAVLLQTQLQRWQLSRSHKNTIPPEQSHINNLLPQDEEVPISSPIETGLPRTESMDTRAQGEASIPIELSQPLPTTPIPSILETWQQVPDTNLPASKLPAPNRLWPMIIILSALAAGLVNFVFTGIGIRPIIVFWFLFICPGMVLVRFLRLKEPVVEWTLAIALSFAIDALAAGIQLYTGKWSPAGTLSILMVLSIGGALVQLAPMGSTTTYLSKLLHIPRTIKPGISLAVSLVWVEQFWGTQLSPRLRSLMPGSVRSATLRQPNKSKSKPSVAQVDTVAIPSHRLHASRAWKPGIVLILLALLIGLGVVTGSVSHVFSHPTISRPTVTSLASRPTPSPTPVPTIHPLIAGTYNGTIYDLSSNVGTNFSLTGVRQSQGKMSGYLILGSRLQGSGPFSGTIGTAKHFQFTVTDAVGHATFFFEGAIQSATSLTGDYYQCSPNPTQNSQCSRDPNNYGIWSAVLVS